MKIKSKKIPSALYLVSFLLFIYLSWLSLRPVEIVAVHQDGEFSDVLVKNFPFTNRGKINWWLKNQDILKEKYHIPNPGDNGFFSVTFWLFGDGYKKEGKYDRRCFEDMNTPINCIDKNKVFSIDKSRNMGISFSTGDQTYRMKENGKIVKYN
ncbi:DUF943 family protein [Rouxiella sp. Mn2063]|uniref:DUF943 family protein n=1 Tax=Rouxiella sp. Mn2063 TaxID=3395262 RepID=UPI003BC2245B